MESRDGRTYLTEKEAQSIFKKNSLKVTADGIGNVDISYVCQATKSRQEISLGGYCDMDPFKWEITDSWTVGESKFCEWDIVTDKSHYVECEGTFLDTDTHDYLWDKEYVDMLLEARGRLKEALGTLAPESDRIYLAIMHDELEFKVSRYPSGGKKRWYGQLTFRGKMKSTKPVDDFFKAKEELDRLLEKMVEEENGD